VALPQVVVQNFHAGSFQGRSGRWADVERDRGFTVAEITVVMAVLMVLFAIGVPTFMGAHQQAKESEAVASLRSAANAAGSVSGRYLVTPAELSPIDPTLTFTSGPSLGPTQVSVGGLTRYALLAVRAKGGECIMGRLRPTGLLVTTDRRPTCSAASVSPALALPLGTITSEVGTGAAGFGGDGGPAVAAQMVQGRQMATRPDGTWAFTDALDHRVRLVQPDGTIRTLAGTGVAGFSGDGGPATAAMIGNPHGLAAGPNGDWYIADTGGRRIRRVSATGIITTIAGTGWWGGTGDGGPALSATFDSLSSLIVDGNRLIVADHTGCVIRAINLSTNVITRIAGNGSCGFSGDGGSATAAQINGAHDIALDGNGNLFIASNGSRVRRLHG
jgi:type II secretory pathway pseudopilin PulG